MYLLGATVVAQSCAAVPEGMSEQPIIGQFFVASRLLDRTALANLATTSFDPRTRGVVNRFSVERVSQGPSAPSPARGRPPDQVVLVERSVNSGGQRVDVTGSDGEIATELVTISARVRLTSGETVQRRFVVTMRRAILRGDHPISGRWIVTAVADHVSARPES